MAEPAIIITCEHATNAIPVELKSEFRGKSRLLRSHRGWDAGALEFAIALRMNLGAPLFVAEYSRLAIDLNRSLHHPKVFSSFTKHVDDKEKQTLIDSYNTYRTRVVSQIRNEIGNRNRVLHLSLHSFTPVLNGETRNCELGLLFDPRRKPEKEFASNLKSAWSALSSSSTQEMRVRLNYPYRGSADGFTKTLRESFPAKKYVGLEIEWNQALLLKLIKRNGALANLADDFTAALMAALTQ